MGAFYMDISSLLQKSNILSEIYAKDKKEAFKILAQVLFKNNCIRDQDEYIKALFQREHEFSTNIGFGIAIPHAKNACVIKTSIAVGTFNPPITYDDGEKVRLIFMLAVPNNYNNLHLEILKNLSRKLMDDDFRKKLLLSKDIDEIWETARAI